MRLYCRLFQQLVPELGRPLTAHFGRYLPRATCRCSYSYGHGTAFGPEIGERCWPLLSGLWRAIALLMKSWCVEGDVPTAANLNLYLHRACRCGDDRNRRSSDGRLSLVWIGKSCWLHRGDVLSWMGSFRTSTGTGRILVWNWNGFTLRSDG